MKKYLLIAFALIIVIAALTNPSKQVHQEKVKEMFYDAFSSDKIGSDDVLGGILMNNLMDQITNQYLRVDNYVLFSVTKIRTDSTSKSIGFGAFGNVFIDMPKDYLKIGKQNAAVENEETGASVKADDYYENDVASSVSAAMDNTAMNARDTVTLLYNEALVRLDSIAGNNNSLAGELSDNQEEISRIKAQINRIVSNRNASRDELQEAKSLIKDLNEKIDNLQGEISRLRGE